ncbi:MAG: hypothetical protein JXB04_03410 [Kiritimatiellae bacterium]|nr:hypothetical protein [Kiritimatiellia bacterium]
MKNALRKTMAERSIKKIEQQLQELEAEPSASFLQPIENTEETYLVKSREKRKERLLAELERYRAIVAKCDNDGGDEKL